MRATCVGNGSDDGEDAEDTVEEDPIRGHGGRERLHALAENIVYRHPDSSSYRGRRGGRDTSKGSDEDVGDDEDGGGESERQASSLRPEAGGDTPDARSDATPTWPSRALPAALGPTDRGAWPLAGFGNVWLLTSTTTKARDQGQPR